MTLSCTPVLSRPEELQCFERRVAIVIPAHNEAAHIGALIERCRRVRPAAIVVVDDASTDGTSAIVSAAASRLNSAVPVVLLRNTRNLGKQGSVRRGLRALREVELDVVALIDGDGQHDPAELPRLAALLDRFDLVIGARSRDEMPLQRQFSNWLVNLGFRVLGGVDFYDVQSGLRLYRKALADVLAEQLRDCGGYALEHESLSVLARHARTQGRTLHAAAAPISCAYGEAESGIGLPQIVQLAGDTVRHALRFRQVAAMDPALVGGA